MPTDTDAATDSAAYGNGSDNPNGQAAAANAAGLDAKMNAIITDRLKRFENRISQMISGDAIANAVSQAIGKLAEAPPSGTVQEQPASNAASGDRLTLKALEEKYKALQNQLQASEKKAQEAEQKARETRARAQVEGKFREALGDSPAVPHLMASLFDVGKRFVYDEAGNVVVKFQREGYEETLPLDQGFKALADSELKHFVPAKTKGLPSTSFPGLQGQPMRPQAPPQNGAPRNPFAEVFAQHAASHGDVGMAQGLLDAVARNTPSK